MILVITGPNEWSATQIGKELDQRGVPWTQMNVGDFPLTMSLDAQMGSPDDSWRGELATADGRIALDEITAVYYGKPTDFVMPPGLSGPELRFSRAQARVGFGGVLASLPVRWFSHPSALADAEYKPRQLALLRRAGLAIPPTLITNRPNSVRDFAAAHGELIVKPLTEPVVYEDGGEAIVYTRRVTETDLASILDDVMVTAHLFQPFEPKAYETRVTAVGDQLFAVAIHAGSDRAHLDWRSDYDALHYEITPVPDDVRRSIARYLELAGLAFSVFDFVVRPDGRWTTLEANCIGQWGWLSEELGLPIAEAIVDALTKE
jgi:ATP-grasp ribosomal peptide maturase